jgi:hypothetical protein
MQWHTGTTGALGGGDLANWHNGQGLNACTTRCQVAQTSQMESQSTCGGIEGLLFDVAGVNHVHNAVATTRTTMHSQLTSNQPREQQPRCLHSERGLADVGREEHFARVLRHRLEDLLLLALRTPRPNTNK